MRIAFLMLISLCYTSFAQVPKQNADELARRVLGNELKEENQDNSHWLFRLETFRPGGAKETDEVVETKNGDLKRPLLINGRPVSKAEADKRLEKFAHSDALQKSQKDTNDDTAQSQELLKMLPDAFIFKFGVHRGNLIQLKFSPNPKFKPPNREAEVFHAMEGSVWLDTKQSRLEEINGHLIHEVKFGGGILGHLDTGGTFDVKQANVAPGYWELTLLNVHMKGKALFFKTIAVQQDYSRKEFKKVPDDLTIEQEVKMLEEQPEQNPKAFNRKARQGSQRALRKPSAKKTAKLVTGTNGKSERVQSYSAASSNSSSFSCSGCPGSPRKLETFTPRLSIAMNVASSCVQLPLL